MLFLFRSNNAVVIVHVLQQAETTYSGVLAAYETALIQVAWLSFAIFMGEVLTANSLIAGF